MHKLAIFASGSGSNAQRIMEYFKESPDISVVLVISNSPSAKVLDRAKNFGIPTFVHQPEEMENGGLLQVLKGAQVDFIVLAGYLKKIGSDLIRSYPNGIVNIHPALLPKFGGKGMYGMNVHKAVVEKGEKESGMTIHYVNEYYDQGDIIEQHRCKVLPADKAEDVAARVLELEHRYFAPCIERILKSK